MRDFVPFIFFSLLIPQFVAAEENPRVENPFTSVREEYQWAIEQVMEHKAPDVSWDGNQGLGIPGNARRAGKGRAAVGATPTPYQTQTYRFQTETDKAKVNATVTDLGAAFIIDVTSDQAIQGWLLKKQSTREVFLKGGLSDNPYQCRIRVERPYVKDFGLTVYVTQDSDPAFLQLF